MPYAGTQCWEWVKAKLNLTIKMKCLFYIGNILSGLAQRLCVCFILLGFNEGKCLWLELGCLPVVLIVNLQFMQTFGTYFLPAGFLVYRFDVCLGKVEMKVVCALGYFSVYWLRNVSWVNSATRSWPKKWREEEAPLTHGGPLAWDLRCVRFS